MDTWHFKVIEQVDKFLNALSVGDQAKVRDLFRIFEEFGPTLPVKYMKRISGTRELWELRAKRVRIFFYIHGDTGIGVHGIIKKSQKTPIQEIKTALLRMRFVKEALQ